MFVYAEKCLAETESERQTEKEKERVKTKKTKINRKTISNMNFNWLVGFGEYNNNFLICEKCLFLGAPIVVV